MGTRTSWLGAAMFASVLLVGCGSSSDDSANGGLEPIGTVGTEPVATVSEVTTSSEEATTTGAPVTTEAASTTTTSEPETTTELDVNRGSALDSVDSFIESWAATAAVFSELPDLAPTISSADVEADPTSGIDVFVEQASPSTVIGGVADPDRGTVTGLMGLSDPDSDDAAAMIEIVWVGAFGADELATLEEFFGPDALDALEIGDQMTRLHEGKSIVLNYIEGATPDDGLFVFTVGGETLLEDDPAHDSITNVVLGLLVRTP